MTSLAYIIPLGRMAKRSAKKSYGECTVQNKENTVIIAAEDTVKKY
jgi:hypothetical protein